MLWCAIQCNCEAEPAAAGARTRSLKPMINDLWYKNAVIYCLSVATYMDANGDGVGDFAGLMRRLDYLQRARRDGDLADAVSNFTRSRRRL